MMHIPRVCTQIILRVCAVLLLAGCLSEEQPEQHVPASTAPTGQAERLFVLDSGKLYEVLDGERTLFAEGPDSQSIYDVAVAPNGTEIALSVHSKPQQTPTSYDFGIDLYVVGPNGEAYVVAEHEKIGESMSNPNWTPDGKALFFMVLGRDETGAIDLHIDHIDLATGVRQRYLDDALEPSLSNDGTTLAYVAYDVRIGSEVIRLMDIATGEQRSLLPDNVLMSNVANIAWSPDNHRLVFASADPLSAVRGARQSAAVAHPTLRDIWLVNVDGTGLQRLTELADATLSLAWSADGRHVYALGDTGFWRVDTADGSLESIGEPVLGGVVQTLLP